MTRSLADFDGEVRVIPSGKGHIAVLGDDMLLPVTDWFDRNGEDCEPEVATACVAGADDIGWITITLNAGIERLN